LTNSAWKAPVAAEDGPWYQLFAGTKGENDGTTRVPAVLLYMARRTPDRYGVEETAIGMYTQPRADGPLKIVSVSGTVVSLQSPSGQTFSFDVAVRKFL
jgi:hypothetical protein